MVNEWNAWGENTGGTTKIPPKEEAKSSRGENIRQNELIVSYAEQSFERAALSVE